MLQCSELKRRKRQVFRVAQRLGWLETAVSARVSSPHSWGESPRSLTHLMEKRRKLRLLLSCQDRCKVGGGRSNLPTASYVHQNPADLHFPRCLRRTFESLYDNGNVVFPLSSGRFCTGFCVAFCVAFGFPFQNASVFIG